MGNNTQLRLGNSLVLGEYTQLRKSRIIRSRNGSTISPRIFNGFVNLTAPGAVCAILDSKGASDMSGSK